MILGVTFEITFGSMLDDFGIAFGVTFLVICLGFVLGRGYVSCWLHTRGVGSVLGNMVNCALTLIRPNPLNPGATGSHP